MSMSSIARKRRSEVQQPQQQVPTYNPNINQQQQQQQQPQQQQQQQKPMGTGLTLPQVIAVIDNRLIHLENFAKENKMVENVTAEISPEFIEEVQTRFDILAGEISELKDVVLKLQSFTMEVNKSLLEERIHILSDLGENKNAVEDS